ncbi:metallophosphoesterase family protein [uncultured Roseobacter sp.]|uniref:metallophosphoesterase family protein n=1 Tax=uncultured Roseobacter sp. TaxID=114847 RepID=UPI0026029A0E|nr:metallophosphoesterase family protein [uncultured Roseobacter sp.]
MAPRFLARLFRGPPPEAPPCHVLPEHRVYAIGDIHGRADLLADLLEKIARDRAAQADARDVKYVFLGDYVDRGERSREVLDQLSALRGQRGQEAVFLRGNHEAALLDFLADPEAGRRWLQFGGDRTLKSYGLDPTGEPEALRERFHAALGPHLDFLQQTERFWMSGEVLFVHAAVNPRRAIADQEDQDLFWGNRAFLRGRAFPGMRVVHGHYNAFEPVVTPQRICVDTGAYYSDRLTAVCLDAQVRFLSTGDP